MWEFNWGVFWAILAAFGAIDIIRWFYNRVVMVRLLQQYKNAPRLKTKADDK